MPRNRQHLTAADMVGSSMRSGLVNVGNMVGLDDMVPCELLGEGTYGAVHMMEEKGTGQKRVVKTVTRPPTWNLEQLKAEAEILQNLDHPHILRIFSWYERDDAVNIVMEHCHGGELLEAVKRGREAGEELPEVWAATALRQSIEAIVYIHSRGVVHKDLKGSNLLLLQNTDTPGLSSDPGRRVYGTLPHVVVCDLGLAEVVSRGIFGNGRGTQIAGTPSTMAPEVWKGSFGHKCDVWSMGCVMFEMFTGKPPFRPRRNEERLWRECYKIGPNWKLWQTGQDAVDVCRKMLTVKESARPSASALLKQQWFRKSARTTFSKEELRSLCTAVRSWKDRNPMQRAMCLKMAVGCTCLRRLGSMFSQFDTDSSGALDKEELVNALVLLGITRKVAKEVAAALDVNGDGSCEYLEFAAACLTSLGEQYDEMLRQEFNSIDLDGDGSLTDQEMEKLMLILRPLAAAHGFSVGELDTDGDGEVSFVEFCTYFGRDGVEYTDKFRIDRTLNVNSTLPMKEHVRLVSNPAGEVDQLKRSMDASQRGSPRASENVSLINNPKAKEDIPRSRQTKKRATERKSNDAACQKIQDFKQSMETLMQASSDAAKGVTKTPEDIRPQKTPRRHTTNKLVNPSRNTSPARSPESRSSDVMGFIPETPPAVLKYAVAGQTLAGLDTEALDRSIVSFGGHLSMSASRDVDARACKGCSFVSFALQQPFFSGVCSNFPEAKIGKQTRRIVSL